MRTREQMLEELVDNLITLVSHYRYDEPRGIAPPEILVGRISRLREQVGR